MTISMPYTPTARQSGRFPPGARSSPPRPSARTAPSTSGRRMKTSMPSTRTARHSGHFPPEIYPLLSGRRGGRHHLCWVTGWQSLCHQPGRHATVGVSHRCDLLVFPGPRGGRHYLRRHRCTGFGGIFYAINPNGTQQWEYCAYTPIQSSPAIGADGTIYFESDAVNNLYAFNPNGTPQWGCPTNSGYPATQSLIQSSPALGADGTLYAGSENGYLYAFTQSAPNQLQFGTQPGSIPCRLYHQSGRDGIGAGRHRQERVSATRPSPWRSAPIPAAATLGGTLTVNAVNGVATFNNLTLNKAGTGYTLTATAAGLTGATSRDFQRDRRYRRAVGLSIPADQHGVGAAISPAVTVVIQDADGNTGDHGHHARHPGVGRQPRRCHAGGNPDGERGEWRGHLQQSHPQSSSGPAIP